MTITIAAFYKFVAIEHPAQLKIEVVALGCRLGIRGTVLVASEGINATISGSPEAIADFLTWLRSDHRFSDLTAKESNALAHPFRRLKVKVKPDTRSPVRFEGVRLAYKIQSIRNGLFECAKGPIEVDIVNDEDTFCLQSPASVVHFK